MCILCAFETFVSACHPFFTTPFGWRYILLKPLTNRNVLLQLHSVNEPAANYYLQGLVSKTYIAPNDWAFCFAAKAISQCPQALYPISATSCLGLCLHCADMTHPTRPPAYGLMKRARKWMSIWPKPTRAGRVRGSSKAKAKAKSCYDDAPRNSFHAVPVPCPALQGLMAGSWIHPSCCYCLLTRLKIDEHFSSPSAIEFGVCAWVYVVGRVAPHLPKPIQVFSYYQDLHWPEKSFYNFIYASIGVMNRKLISVLNRVKFKYIQNFQIDFSGCKPCLSSFWHCGSSLKPL